MSVPVLFNEAWYLKQNPDVAEAVNAGLTDAYTHYEQYGREEGRQASPLFDVATYLEDNPDVARAVEAGETTAYDHFEKFGAAEGRAPLRLFDEAEYLRLNPDVADAVAQGLMTAAEHLLNHGHNEGRLITPAIDLDLYLQANPDVQRAVEETGISPLEHLIMYGVEEDRSLGNGISLSQFRNDPIYNALEASDDHELALMRITEVAPFMKGFIRPEGWTPAADARIPVDFVIAEGGEKLVVPPEVKVPEGVTLPGDVFELDPAEPGTPGEGGGGGGGGGGAKIFTLTPGDDAGVPFQGTNYNDTYNAKLKGGANTLTAGDDLDGGDGEDTLNATLTGAGTTSPTGLTSIENVNLTFQSDHELDLTNANGVQAISVQNSNGSAQGPEAVTGVVSGIGAVHDLSVRNQNANVTFDGVTDAEVALAVENVGTDYDGVNPAGLTTIQVNPGQSTIKALDVSANNANFSLGNATGLEELNIEATGVNALNAEAAYSTVTGIEVTGTGSLDLTGGGARAYTLLDSLDASGNSGGVKARINGDTETVTGGTGDDHIILDGSYGESGDIDLGAGDDILDGGVGNDTVSGGDGNDQIRGGLGNDVVSGGAGNDWLYGNEGNDLLDGGDGDDMLDGGVGDDILIGGRGADQIDVGLGGTDTVVVNAAVDQRLSDSGKGELTGGLHAGEDTVKNFEWGTDVIKVKATGVNAFEHGTDTGVGGNARVSAAEREFTASTGVINFGGQGSTFDGGDIALTFDQIPTGDGPFEAAFEAALQYELTGTTGADQMSGGSQDDILIGNGGDDIIDGGAGDDWIDLQTGSKAGEKARAYGGEGDDTIIGGLGDDEINSGEGDDRIEINWGEGDDIIDGGEGNDTVVLNGFPENGTDLDDYKISTSLVDGVITTTIRRNEGTSPTLTLRNVESLLDSEGNEIPGIRVQIGDPESDADQSLTGTPQNDLITGGSGNDTINGLAGDDWIKGGAGNDDIDGGQGNDDIEGGDGDDIIDGGDGDDTINGGDGIDTIDGGVGNDTINGGNGNDTIDGGDGDDTINGGEGDDVIDGGVGNDTLNGGNGNDTIDGGLGDDTIDGGDGDDILRGGDGSDTILGGGGNDQITGGAGADDIDLGDGEEDMVILNAVAGVSSDSGVVGPLDGNAIGEDTITNFDWDAQNVIRVVATNVQSFAHGENTHFGTLGLSETTGGIDLDYDGDQDDIGVGDLAVTFSDGIPTDEDAFESALQYHLTGTGNADVLTGGILDDVIDGGAGNDTINGGDGNDDLRGGAGDDTIDGGVGDDIITGGAGNDILTGGAGADTFVIAGFNEAADTIKDFEVGEGGDWLDLTGFNFAPSRDAIFIDSKEGDRKLLDGDVGQGQLLVIYTGTGDEVLNSAAEVEDMMLYHSGGSGQGNHSTGFVIAQVGANTLVYFDRHIDLKGGSNGVELIATLEDTLAADVAENIVWQLPEIA